MGGIKNNSGKVAFYLRSEDVGQGSGLAPRLEDADIMAKASAQGRG